MSAAKPHRGGPVFLLPSSIKHFLSDVSGLDELRENFLELTVAEFMPTHDLSVGEPVPDVLDQSFG